VIEKNFKLRQEQHLPRLTKEYAAPDGASSFCGRRSTKMPRLTAL